MNTKNKALKLKFETIHTNDLVAVLVNVLLGQLHQRPPRQVLPMSPRLHTHFLRKRTSVLRVLAEYLHPRVVAHHMTVRTDRGLHHRHHRHGINVVLALRRQFVAHRQHVLLLLHRSDFYRLRLRDVSLPRLRFSLRLLVVNQRALPLSVAKAKHQLPLAVEAVVVVVDLPLLDQLSIEVAALVANATGNVHRKDTPLTCQSSASPT